MIKETFCFSFIVSLESNGNKVDSFQIAPKEGGKGLDLMKKIIFNLLFPAGPPPPVMKILIDLFLNYILSPETFSGVEFFSLRQDFM